METTLKDNALYIYTFAKNKFCSDSNDYDDDDDDDDLCDVTVNVTIKEELKKYIFFESNPARINYFEKFLQNTNNRIPISTKSTYVSKKIISHYFLNKKKSNVLIDFILQDFKNLSKRYKNYQKFLFYHCNSFTQRKFLLNLVLFMEKKINNTLIIIIIMKIIQLWHLVDIDINILENEFIPLAFSKWYENYPFYNDFFCIITKKSIKDDFLKSFFNSILANKNIDEVNNDIKNVLKKYSPKQFYVLPLDFETVMEN